MRQQVAERLLGELDTTLETDGEQQQNAHKLVNRGRKTQLRAQQTGDEAQQKKQDNRIDYIHCCSLSRLIDGVEHYWVAEFGGHLTNDMDTFHLQLLQEGRFIEHSWSQIS